jgi:hypothetical protein
MSMMSMGCRSRRRAIGRRGHALMELVVAIPILGVAAAAAAAFIVTSGGLLLEAERRLETAALGVSLMDSVAIAAPGDSLTGSLMAGGREVSWRWDGVGTLELDVEGIDGDGSVVWRLRRGMEAP